MKFKNKNLDKIRLMINSEIEEKFKNIQPAIKNPIKHTQQKENIKLNQNNNDNINHNNKNNNNINIINNKNESDNEEIIDEDEIDDIFIELL